MPLPRLASHSRKPTMAPRPLKYAASSERAMRTMSLDAVGVIRNDNAPFIPSDPVEIRDSTLHVQATAIRPVGLPNRAAPVADAGDSDGKKARLVGRTMIGKLPEGEGLELAF